jgi:hypothetical protein
MPQKYRVLDNGQDSAKKNQRKASKAAAQPRNKKGPTSRIDASYIGRVKEKAEKRAGLSAYRKYGRKGGVDLFSTEQKVTSENMPRTHDMAMFREQRAGTETARKTARARADKTQRIVTANKRASNKKRRTTKKY